MSEPQVQPQPSQLQMLWPANLFATPAKVRLPLGYHLRLFSEKDTDAYLTLVHEAGFAHFDEASVLDCARRTLPDGLFVIEHEATGVLAATALANHIPTELHPNGGELGWVAGSVAHAGKGLGIAVCSAVINRFMEAGYRRIYLKTDDWRLAALKSYLKMGFEPFLFLPDMPERWQAVCEKLKWPYTPKAWPQA